MKEKQYTIRLTELMQNFIKKKSREMQLLPSEYLRLLIQREIDKEPKELHYE